MQKKLLFVLSCLVLNCLLLNAQNTTVAQKTISPDHGVFRAAWPAGVCRFQPTCSEYMKQSISEQGWRGILRGLHQLSRCYPFSS